MPASAGLHLRLRDVANNRATRIDRQVRNRKAERGSVRHENGKLQQKADYKKVCDQRVDIEFTCEMMNGAGGTQ